MSPKKPPHLGPDIVAAEQLLAEAIDRLLVADSEMLRHRRRILRSQQGLRRLLSRKGWRAYMRLEETVNGRFGVALRLVAAWAFKQGRQCRR